MTPAPGHRTWRRTTQALVLAVLAVGTLLPAAPAQAASRVRDVTIDCAGDAVSGHVTMTDPVEGTMLVELFTAERASQKPGTKVAEKTVPTSEWANEVGYSFSLADHAPYYRVRATIGRSSRTSAAVGDPTCAPPAQVPEAGAAGLLLLVMGGAAGAVFWVRRRSATRAGAAAA